MKDNGKSSATAAGSKSKQNNKKSKPLLVEKSGKTERHRSKRGSGKERDNGRLYKYKGEQNAYYKAVVEAFDGLIYVCSPDYRIEFMNRQFIEKTGYDACGEYCYKVFHARDAICPWCINDRVFRGETVRYETLVPKDNKWYYVMNTPVYHNDGTMSKQALIIDVSEKKQTEDALRESEDKFRVLYENNPAMYFIIDTGGKVLSVNQYGAEHLGYSIEELTGQEVLKVFHPDDKKSVARQFTKCLNSPGKVEQWEFRKVRKDGSLMWVKESACSIMKADNSQIVLVVCNDINELKLTEEALRKSREEMKDRVKELEEFYDLAVSRELKMIEIKKHNKRLTEELERLNIYIDE